MVAGSQREVHAEETGGDTELELWCGDSSFEKSGGEDGESWSHGRRGGLEPGGLGCCCFKTIKGLQDTVRTLSGWVGTGSGCRGQGEHLPIFLLKPWEQDGVGGFQAKLRAWGEGKSLRDVSW